MKTGCLADMTLWRIVPRSLVMITITSGVEIIQKCINLKSCGGSNQPPFISNIPILIKLQNYSFSGMSFWDMRGDRFTAIGRDFLQGV